MRYDELTGEWVAIAAHRMDRTHLPPADLCPLCPTRPGREPTEIPADDYDVVVFENRFPSFAGAAGHRRAARSLPAHGRCEVVCFTSDHDRSFAELGASADPHGDRGVGRPHRRAVGAVPASSRSPCSRTAATRSA